MTRAPAIDKVIHISLNYLYVNRLRTGFTESGRARHAQGYRSPGPATDGSDPIPMPERRSTDSRTVQLPPIMMPSLSVAALGDWRSRGQCVGEDPEVFFPSYGDPGTEARQVCAACPVRGQCLGHATAADELGIWGGLDQRERRNLKRRQQRMIAVAPGGDGSAGGAA